MRVLLLYFLQFVIFLDVSKCTKEWEKGHNEQGEKQNRQVKQQIQGQNKNVQRNEFYRNQAIMNQKHLLDQIQHHRTDLTTSQLNQEKQPQHNFFQNQHISQQSMKKIKLEPEDIHQQQIQHEKEKQPRITYHLDSSDEDGLEIIGDDETFAEPGQRLLNQAEQHRIDLTTNQSNQANQPQHNFFQNQHIGQQPLELKLEPENIQQQQIQQGKEKQPRIIIELDSSDDDGLEIIEENEKKAQNTYNKGKNIKEINIQNNENIQKPSSSSGININPERKRSQSKEVITFDVKPQDFKAKVQQCKKLSQA
uniref:Uncharacterized protein n=1 Tax=Meloidogyne hapla TaxID=6305 RepID=A0A1I8BQF7_MELHA